MHTLEIKNQSIFLEPPLENARMNWLKEFSLWTGIIASLSKVKVFAYAGENSGPNLTYSNLLERVNPELLKAVYMHIEEMFANASLYVGKWLKYQSLWDLQATPFFDDLGDDLELWCSTLAEVKSERSTFDTTKSFHVLQSITIHFGDVQTKVNSIYDQWQRDLLQQFSFVLRSSMSSLNNLLVESRIALETSASLATKDMVDLIVKIKVFSQKAVLWANQLKKCHESQRLLERQRFQFPNDWLFYEQVSGEHSAFQEILNTKNLTVSEQRPTLELRINQENDLLESQISAFLQEWAEGKPVSGDFMPTSALSELSRFQKNATALYFKFKQIEEAKVAIDLSGATVDPFKVVFEELNDLQFVWTNLLEVWTAFESIKSILWLSEKCWDVKAQLDSLLKALNQMSNKIRQYVAYQTLLEKVVSTCKIHSACLALKSEALRERHWIRILSAAKMEISPNSLTVDIVWNSSGFRANEKTIEEIIFSAQGEMSLEAFLKQVKLFWDGCNFEFVNFQNKCRLVKGWDDLFNKCQDHLSALSSMKNSVHFKAFKSQALLLESSLSRLYSLLDVWVKVQRQWVYLQGIFNDNQEMRLILPMESSRFASVDGEFMAVLRKVYKTPLVIDAVSIPNILTTMERLNDLLYGIQKSLGEYLERERLNFARFYFIADEDLLEILGNSKDVSRIEPHLKKMFSAIHGFLLSAEGTEVVGVVSKEGERIQFKNPISTKPRVYIWLLQVENEVKKSLQDYLKFAVQDPRMRYLENLANPDATLALVADLPCQILILASQIHWTEILELSLSSGVALNTLQVNASDFIALLAELVVRSIDRFSRGKIEALITELVHQRDVIRKLIDFKVASNNDFLWLSHLRIYYAKEDVLVKMGKSSFKYGFEYLGIQDRLVQTPLTDRCYLTLTQALYNKLGGSPFGPAGNSIFNL